MQNIRLYILQLHGYTYHVHYYSIILVIVVLTVAPCMQQQAVYILYRSPSIIAMCRYIVTLHEDIK